MLPMNTKPTSLPVAIPTYWPVAVPINPTSFSAYILVNLPTYFPTILPPTLPNNLISFRPFYHTSVLFLKLIHCNWITHINPASFKARFTILNGFWDTLHVLVSYVNFFFEWLKVIKWWVDCLLLHLEILMLQEIVWGRLWIESEL